MSNLQTIDELLDAFEQLWKDGEGPAIEDFVVKLEEPDRSELFLGLIETEVELRQRAKGNPEIDEYLSRFPNRENAVSSAFAAALRRCEDATVDPTVIGAVNSEIPETIIGDAAQKPDETLNFIVADDTGILNPLTSQGPPKGIGSGTVLNSRYKLIKVLGEGGMGTVMLGEDTRLGRPIAVKFIRIDHWKSRQCEYLTAEFENEAKLGASLKHPSIATVYDYGFQGDTPYTIFELVEGESLTDVIAKRAPMHIDDVRDIIGRLAMALDYAHEKGIVHRDLKPDNIRTDEYGVPKILDFGLAKDFRSHTDWRFAGTAAYASPEQAREEPSDGRSDQYALGLITYEMLTGEKPFAAANWSELLKHHRESTAIWPGHLEVGPLVVEGVRTAMSKAPDERHSCCVAFAAAIGCHAEQSGAASDLEIMVAFRLFRAGIRHGLNSLVHIALSSTTIWIVGKQYAERIDLDVIQKVSRNGKLVKLYDSSQTFSEQNRETKGTTEDKHPPNRAENTRRIVFRTKGEAIRFETYCEKRLSGRGRTVWRKGTELEVPILVRNRPPLRLAVLAERHATGRTEDLAEGQLRLLAAVEQANLVVEMKTEKVYSKNGMTWAARGLICRTLNDSGRQQLATIAYKEVGRRILLRTLGVLFPGLLLLGIFAIVHGGASVGRVLLNLNLWIAAAISLVAAFVSRRQIVFCVLRILITGYVCVQVLWLVGGALLRIFSIKTGIYQGIFCLVVLPSVFRIRAEIAKIDEIKLVKQEANGTLICSRFERILPTVARVVVLANLLLWAQQMWHLHEVDRFTLESAELLIDEEQYEQAERLLDTLPSGHFAKARLMAAIRCQQDELGEAERFVDAAIELAPDADCYNLRARIRFDIGDFHGALNDASEAIAVDPGNSDAFVVRVATLNALGRMSTAIQDARHAVKLAPDSWEAHFCLVKTLVLTGAVAEAANSINRSTEFLPFSDGKVADLYYSSIIDLAETIVDLDDSSSIATAAMSLCPSRPEAYATRCWSNLKKDDLDMAIVDAKKSVAQSSSDWRPFCVLALIPETIADNDARLELLTRAIELGADTPMVFEARARTYAQLGNSIAASQDRKRALEIRILLRSDDEVSEGISIAEEHTLTRSEVAEIFRRHQHLAQLIQDFPSDFALKRIYVESCKRYAEVTGETDVLQDGLAQKRLIVELDSTLEDRSDLGAMLNNLSLTLPDDSEQAVQFLEEAVGHQKVAVKGEWDLSTSQRYLDIHYVNLIRRLTGIGRFEQAQQTILDRVLLWPDNGEKLYDCALSLHEVLRRSPSFKHHGAAVGTIVTLLKRARKIGYTIEPEALHDQFSAISTETAFIRLVKDAGLRAEELQPNGR